MRPPRAAALACLLVLSVSARPYEPAAGSRTADGLTITDLRAHLFYSDQGSFSRNILAQPAFALWNTVIGAGDAKGPSNATLLVVEVTGTANSYPSKAQVEIAVSTKGREILRRHLPVGLLGEKGHAYVAFWLDNTGCEPLRVSTALLGQTDPSRRVATIPFECGE